jgi:hypothetical protein
VRAMSHARLQLRMRLQNGIQRRLVAEHQRSGRIVLVPIRPERESLLDGDDKKARFSVTIAILCTTSSYLIDAQASRGGARFFSCAAPRSRRKRRLESRLRQLATGDAAPSGLGNGCLKEERPLLLSK